MSGPLTAVKVWDAKDGTELVSVDAMRGRDGVLIGHDVPLCAFSPDGRRIVSGGPDNTVTIWDVTTGSKVHTLRGHTMPVSAAAFSPDGSRIVSASYDRTVRMWDTKTGQEMLTISGHTTEVCAVAWNPDGDRIVTGSIGFGKDQDCSLRIWDAVTGAEVLTLRPKNLMRQVFSVAWSPDGCRIVAGGNGGTACVWNCRSSSEEEKPASPPSKK